MQTKKALATIIYSQGKNKIHNRFLKDGYQHCAVLLEFSDRVVYINPRYTDIEIGIIGTTKPIKEYGLNIQQIEVEHTGLFLLPKFRSCVSIVKLVLGLDKCKAVTPWQLNQYIRENFLLKEDKIIC